ncbi:MAG: Smr/MutS family protein [Rhodobacteraceae bacterium]|nr:Smr/MutS family protein [Paracoccaceae bacterium]MCY4250419.1 Smr/MutS family protein [Paracoccaceae bacterium]MCY4307399.1 Smr/MutS family protein [Paracoccaceae bacterium]
MRNKINTADLSDQDLVLWKEYCQTNGFSSRDNHHTSQGSRKVKSQSSRKENPVEALNNRDLSDWNLFCKENDLPLSASKAKTEPQEEKIALPKPVQKRILVQPRHSEPKINVPGPNNVDKKILRKLNSGHINPELRLDLHGMLKEEASQEVKRFVSGAFDSGKRLILVIPGKGKDIDGRRGFGPLNQLIRHLLSKPPTSEHILHFQEAHRCHGGSGAYYIYLKRKRSRR